MDCAKPSASLTVRLFQGRIAVLATMHHKEQVIAPLLETELGMQVHLPSAFEIDLDTDQFGTFTRDIKRPADQLNTARLKIQAALDKTGQTLGIASEGAFGPHPALPYLPCDREMVVLIDREHDLELVGQVVALETNYSHCQIRSYKEALEFGHKAGFPQHGLVVIAGVATGEVVDRQKLIKGIVTAAQLQEAVSWALTQAETVQVETDMRALYNPTRMKVIEQATQELLKQVKSVCPECEMPGFSVIERRPGLPCSLCRLPTSLIRTAVYQCQVCQFSQEILFPDGVEMADPTYCSYCNP
ncbi:MAG: hypothetical protein Kow00121_23810 [Elainellaceae cyanobacterium]